MDLEEKYKPVYLKDIKFNEVGNILQGFSLETIPHLIVYGKTGSGKRTLVYALINHLFGKIPKVHHRDLEIETASKKKFNISYKEANEYVEICPSDYDFKDKDVIQDMIKNIAETRPILSLISNKTPKMKLIVVTQAEKLSKDAQAALRRTVETYSKNFRIIMICDDLNQIIDPIKSRTLCLGVNSVTNEQLLEELKLIVKKEKIEVTDNVLEQIVYDSKNNLRRALFFLDQAQKKPQDSKRKKSQKEFILDWEEQVDEIVIKAISARNSVQIIEIRTKLNKLIVDCIPPKYILKRLFQGFRKSSKPEYLFELSSLTAKYDGRLVLGSKSIFHLEAYVLAVLTTLFVK
ncbi:Replication factor C, subunit RFC3 [Pseudoloma neurophilia]|uniref:Replication factor C, subunit RFC3 n=1 Tax=Pseudoloma neurophilia TaxID=146866 RepID=A0A0R0LWX6_9MICR|nr:Replication factor C, subunit RFC3 [Pseudoloma neurophilia]